MAQQVRALAMRAQLPGFNPQPRAQEEKRLLESILQPSPVHCSTSLLTRVHMHAHTHIHTDHVHRNNKI